MEEISIKLNKNGVACTGKLCETKMKNLKRSYATCIDHNKKSGSDRKKKCAYFDELHEIYARYDNIEPQALCSNVDGPVKRGQKLTRSDQESSAASDNEVEEIPVAPPKTKK